MSQKIGDSSAGHFVTRLQVLVQLTMTREPAFLIQIDRPVGQCSSARSGGGRRFVLAVQAGAEDLSIADKDSCAARSHWHLLNIPLGVY